MKSQSLDIVFAMATERDAPSIVPLGYAFANARIMHVGHSVTNVVLLTINIVGNKEVEHRLKWTQMLLAEVNDKTIDNDGKICFFVMGHVTVKARFYMSHFIVFRRISSECRVCDQ